MTYGAPNQYPGPGYLPQSPGAPASRGTIGWSLAAIVLGTCSLVIPLVPIGFNSWSERAGVGAVLAVVALVPAVIGLVGKNPGRALGIIGAVIAVASLVLWGAAGLLRQSDGSSDADDGMDKASREILEKDLNVSFGEVVGDVPAVQSMPVTLYNKGADLADFYVTIQLRDSGTDTTCLTHIGASALEPGARVEETVYSCFDDDAKPLLGLNPTVVGATKSNF